MRNQFLTALVLAGLAGICAPHQAAAQAAATSPAPPPQSQPAAAPETGAPLLRTPCGNPVQAPSATPPAGTTFIWIWEPCFPTQENLPNVEPETYQFYSKISGLVSRPRDGVWSPWNEQARNVVMSDFKALMQDTSFLDDLRIERTEYTFPNGAVGVILSYIMEERERVKIVDYRDGKGEPIKIIKRSDIDDKLREKNINVRLDAAVDLAMIRRVETVLDDMMTEKGFANSRITHTLTPVAGGAKLINVTFVINEGAKQKISKIDFIGNTAVSDGSLTKRIKENKPKGSLFTLGFLKPGGTWK